MKKLENLIVEFKETGCDVIFGEIYELVREGTISAERGSSYFEKVAKSMDADSHDVSAVFDDTLLNAIRLYTPGNDFLRYFKSSWKRRRANLYVTTHRIIDNELQWIYDDDGEGGESYALDFQSPTDIEEEVTAKKKADQLALIDSLLEGADEITIGVVRTFLNHQKPTATAIAKELGVHHSKVTRILNRLAGKFSTKQHGNYHDYLVAL